MYRAGELPAWHRDPFERLLVAAALRANAAIPTPDEAVRRYRGKLPMVGVGRIGYVRRLSRF